jgi:lysophospholipase L1-like esterase
MSKYMHIFLFVGVFWSLGSEGKADAIDFCIDPLPLTNIWLIGDSTIESGSGWGDFLADFVTEVNVLNRAQGGKSSKSYYETEANLNGWRGKADSVMNNISAGDYVFIQFGHNDISSTPTKHTEPGVAPDYAGSYRNYLELYIAETRAAGGIPILITPVSTMFFGFGSHNRIFGNYPFAIHQVGLDHSVIVLDLELRSHELFDALGEAETLRLYGGFRAELGVDDRTHFLPEKAPGITELVADLLQEANIPLSCHVSSLITNAPTIINLTANQNINTTGGSFIFNWSANGTIAHAWELQVGPSNWLGQFTSAKFPSGKTTLSVDFNKHNLPQDGTPLFATLRYAADQGWVDWRTAQPIEFTAGGEVPPPTGRVPILPIEDVRAQTPSRPDYNLAELGVVTPEFPAVLGIPPQPVNCNGLSSHTPNTEFARTTSPDGPIHWRRITSRFNPLVWMAMAASDSDLKDDATRNKVWNTTNNFFEHLLAESLPQNNQAGDTNENELTHFLGEERGHFDGHPFVTFIIPYAELTQLQIAEDAVIGHAEWMLWQQKNGDHGFIQSPNTPFSIRPWMRRLKNLIVFSDSPILAQRPGLKEELVEEADKMLDWFLGLNTDGTGNVSSIGWDAAANAQYFDESAVLSPQFYSGHRVIHMRFHAIWNETLEQLKNTSYYKGNPSSIDLAIQRTRTTTNTVLSTAPLLDFQFQKFGQSPEILPPFRLTLTNFRAHAWFLDEYVNCTQGLCNVVQPTGSKDGKWFELPASDPEKIGKYGFVPITPWVSVDTLADFDKIEREMCISSWRPNFRYQPGVVSAYTRLK